MIFKSSFLKALARRLNLFKKPISMLVIFSGSWAFLLAVFGLDYMISFPLNLLVFYLLPILLITYKDGVRHALFMAAAAATLWMVSDIASGYRYQYSFLPYWNAVSRFLIFSGGSLLLHFWRESNLRARFDELTGLPNRRSFMESADAEIKRSHRYKRPFSLAYIDMDNLKMINDRLGHKAGDKVLIHLASVLRSNIRNVDIAARLGGDEFVILMPETNESGAAVVMERIQKRLQTVLPLTKSPLTISAGLSTFSDIHMSVDELLQKSDQLMYQAKNEGKNRLKLMPSQSGKSS